MRLSVLFSLPILCSASMLSDAEALGQKYVNIVAKSSPPSSTPLTKQLLRETSAWLSIDLQTLIPEAGKSVLETLGSDPFWQILQDLGFDGVEIQNLKKGGTARVGFEIDPKWGSGWAKIEASAKAHGMMIVGDLIGSAMGLGVDFEMALKNVPGYRELYHLIEIDRVDWALLPKVSVGSSVANVPWMELESLYKKGYVPESMHTYVKESSWNATAKIRGNDGMERRWIYLKENQNDPELSWLSSTFGADRLASADALDSIYNLGEKILKLDAKMPLLAQETEALWIRKIGGYTVADTTGTLLEMQKAPTDLIFDAPTKPALMHALVSEDAEALRLIYSLYLQQGIAPMRLVHSLTPFAFEWREFLANPTKRYNYTQEKITGEVLRERLLKEDLLRLKKPAPTATWAAHCSATLQPESTEPIEVQRERVQKAHLLLALTYAMQPGVFSLSAADLVGALTIHSIALMGKNQESFYPSLPSQMQTPRSFASHLKTILQIRSKSQIASGELAAVPPVDHRGSFLLLHRLPNSRFFQLLAVNFSRSPVQEKLKLASIKDTWAIDLMTGLSVDKPFDADLFSFDLPPLSGKVFLFQPKYYD